MFVPILSGKVIGTVSRMFGFGAGLTWSGEVALKIDRNILAKLIKRVDKGIIIVVGTNGKTTTAKMLIDSLKILNKGKLSVVHNSSGANLINGITGSFINQYNFRNKKFGWAAVEVDEASFVKFIPFLKGFDKRLCFVFLNLFRDQLDRYGEVDSILYKWKNSISEIPSGSSFVVNADDPGVYEMGAGSDLKKRKIKTYYYAIDINKYRQERNVDRPLDFQNCLRCSKKLIYLKRSYSHLGIWKCTGCGNKRPGRVISGFETGLEGLYNEYNTQAAGTALQAMGYGKKNVKSALKKIKPAFGRQEIISWRKTKFMILLSKNPTGMNESLRIISEKTPDRILILLNDRIPDGKDVSWIWDADFEILQKKGRVYLSGDRVYDLALRLKYAGRASNKEAAVETLLIENLKEAVIRASDSGEYQKTVYALCTYSAMLDLRKILTGKKI